MPSISCTNNEYFKLLSPTAIKLTGTELMIMMASSSSSFSLKTSQKFFGKRKIINKFNVATGGRESPVSCRLTNNTNSNQDARHKWRKLTDNKFNRKMTGWNWILFCKRKRNKEHEIKGNNSENRISIEFEINNINGKNI